MSEDPTLRSTKPWVSLVTECAGCGSKLSRAVQYSQGKRVLCGDCFRAQPPRTAK